MGLGKPPASTSSAMKPPANTAKGAFDGAPYRTDCFVALYLVHNAVLKVMGLQVGTIFPASISFVRKDGCALRYVCTLQ